MKKKLILLMQTIGIITYFNATNTYSTITISNRSDEQLSYEFLGYCLGQSLTFTNKGKLKPNEEKPIVTCKKTKIVVNTASGKVFTYLNRLAPAYFLVTSTDIIEVRSGKKYKWGEIVRGEG